MDHCLRSRHYVNIVVAGKQPSPQWLTMDAAVRHCTAGIGAWDWASNDGGGEPDLVMAAAGDVPTLEMLAAVTILRRLLPKLKIRTVNVVDLMKLQPQSEHPHGLSDDEFDALFTKNKPIIFAYHGYPWLIHRLAYRRTNHKNLHVRGYKEEGTITTPFDMTVLNDIDRFHLAQDAIRRLPRLAARAPKLIQELDEKLSEHHRYIREHGQDMPEIRNWRWGSGWEDERLGALRLLRLAGGGPAGLVDLRNPRKSQSPVRHVLGDRRAGRDVGAGADGHGRDELHVGPDEGALADLRGVLLLAVVIARDDPGADVGAGADVRVPEVGEVLGLGALADAGVLGLDEVADAGVLLDDRLRTKAGEGTHARPRTDRRASRFRSAARPRRSPKRPCRRAA